MLIWKGGDCQRRKSTARKPGIGKTNALDRCGEVRRKHEIKEKKGGGGGRVGDRGRGRKRTCEGPGPRICRDR